jgi:hypothetical protein
VIIIKGKPYITSFNSEIPLAEFRCNEQHYTRTTKLWYHASVARINTFSKNISKRDPLTHFSTKKEFSIDFYSRYRGRKQRFGYMHFCRLEKTVDLLNFQSPSDYQKVVTRFPELKDFIDRSLIQNSKNPRYFMFTEKPVILAAARALNFDGLATFGDNPDKIKGFHEAENIGLFDATFMRVVDIRAIDLYTRKISKNSFLFAPEDQSPEF